MNSLSWYLNLYYKFREYPVSEVNAAHKPNELRALYSGMLKKQFVLFQLDNRRDGEIQGIISKNNYDHLLNKKAESNLEQEEALQQEEPQLDSRMISRQSVSSIDQGRDSIASVGSQESRWLVQTGPNQKNMDVFYELMIKMIRISFRRLTIEAFAFDRYGQTLSKEGVRDTLRSNTEYAELYGRIAAEGEKKEEDPNIVEEISFPASIEELKYEFLKYAITCKVYNTPVPKGDSISESLVSFQSSRKSLDSSESVSSIPSVIVPPPVVGDNQIQTLILRVSDSETSVFNELMDDYLQAIRKGGNNQIQILGVKNIAQSVFEMASGKPTFHTATNSLGINRNRFRRGIFDEQGEYARESDALSNSNLLLATWFDLILFKEKPATLHQIIEKLVSLGDRNSYLASVGAPDRPQSSSKFYLKVSSYLHLLILNSTKNLFAQSLCRINYLLVVSQDVLSETPQQPRRPYKQIRLRNFQSRSGSSECFQNIQLTYDTISKKFIWKEQAMQILLSKWKVIANVITELCVKNSRAFFASIFQKCVQLLDQQLELQVQLVQQLMEVSDGLALEGEIKQKEGERCQGIRRGLNAITKELIGFAGDRGQEGEEEKYLGINSFANLKSHQRYKEATFVNREESAQELGKWSEIMSENIYLFRQYRQNLQAVNGLFKSNQIYVALWFNKFHAQSKILLKKLGRPRLDRIFSKFLLEVPVLWESLNSQKQQKRSRNRLKRCEKSKFRNRISSIKTEGPLSLTEKKAIVLNYMVKAELQLYSHYTQVNLLSGQKNLADFFQKGSAQKNHRRRPEIFSHPLIKALLLFQPEQDTEEHQKQPQVRRDYRRFTSNFAMEELSYAQVENPKTMNNIQKGEVSMQLQQLLRVVAHFEKPMNIELDLKENWKERFGDLQVAFLAEVSDHIRYLNEINYLYQFWICTDQKPDENRTSRVDLLCGAEYQEDLAALDAYFKELKGNREFMGELLLMRGQPQKLVADEQLSEMLRRIRMHNKELYMINETIIEAENYFKLLAGNLVGRDRNQAFHGLLEEVIATYKTSKRQRPSMRAQQGSPLESISHRFDPKKPQIRFQQPQKTYMRETLKESGRIPKRAGAFVSHFQFAPQYYKIQAKILRVNCLIAAFDVDNSIYRNIKSYRALSHERVERLAIIGSKYYDKLQLLLGDDKGPDRSNLHISEELLVRTKNIYEKKLLLVLTTLINLSYNIQGRLQRDRGTRREFTNIPEEHVKNYASTLMNYTDILKRFIYCKVRENIKRMQERERFEQANNQNDRKEDRQFSICRFIEQVLELTQKRQDFGEQSLLLALQSAVQKQTNLKFYVQFRRQLQGQGQNLQAYKLQEEKVEYLRKRLSYLLMREMYFGLNYDNDFLEEKSVNSRRNYSIYEERILTFYEEIIRLDYEEYLERKEEELKKRSVHLRNYQFKYQRQPQVCGLQKAVNQLICCLFNQLLITYTSSAEYKMFTRRHKPLAQSDKPHGLFNQYCASEYSKIAKKDPQKTERKIVKREPAKQKQRKDSISSIFAQIFNIKIKEANQQEKPQQSQEPQKPSDVELQQQKQQRKVCVLVYTEQKFQLSQSIKVYLKALMDYEYSAGRGKTRNQFTANSNTLRQQPITQMQLQIIKINERSLITMLKSDFLQKINSAKCSLIRKNLISNIQKLYINLDVRHKVFQSFKDRILNYQMQKTKIYHQYMDYIRGLKLDVYSHMAGEQSLPYIKIIHAVKLYRLQVKKLQLEQRVNQEFQKNLQKWNIGIHKNMAAYDQWLEEEQTIWSKHQQKYMQEKKDLFQIFHAVSKEMSRQKKSQVRKNSLNNIPSFQPVQQEPKVEEVKQQQKMLIKKSIIKQKQPFLEKKMSQPEIIVKTNNNSLVYIPKYAASQSTKPQTRYEKMSMTSKSQAGLKGLFIKYDLGNLQPKEEEQRAKQEDLGRRTEVCCSTLKASAVFKKKERYQSAQKYRSPIQPY